MKDCNMYEIKKYEPFWGKWLLEDFIGDGSYGSVYKISKMEWNFRTESNFKTQSALKVISIPTKEQVRDAMSITGDNPRLLGEYFHEYAMNIINEIRILYRLRGHGNIVSYEDHIIEESKSGEGWDILIRMELVKPLTSITLNRKMDYTEVLRLGKDICTALDCCVKNGIIHRDIKEDNIFISKEGNFKLGDFGIAREMSRGEVGASIRGTPLYLAPEVFKGGKCDERSDIYSLGILLYKLLNKGRYPFLPNYPQEVKLSDNETALKRRLSGEPVPELPGIKKELQSIIQKTCSYKPAHRYSNAAEMKSELEKLVKDEVAEEWPLSGPKELKVEGEWIFL